MWLGHYLAPPTQSLGSLYKAVTATVPCRSSLVLRQFRATRTMRKTRLVILPGVRSITQIGCLLLFLACPTIAFKGQEKRDVAPICKFHEFKYWWLPIDTGEGGNLTLSNKWTEYQCQRNDMGTLKGKDKATDSIQHSCDENISHWQVVIHGQDPNYSSKTNFGRRWVIHSLPSSVTIERSSRENNFSELRTTERNERMSDVTYRRLVIMNRLVRNKPQENTREQKRFLGNIPYRLHKRHFETSAIHSTSDRRRTMMNDRKTRFTETELKMSRNKEQSVMESFPDFRRFQRSIDGRRKADFIVEQSIVSSDLCSIILPRRFSLFSNSHRTRNIHSQERHETFYKDQRISISSQTNLPVEQRGTGFETRRMVQNRLQQASWEGPETKGSRERRRSIQTSKLRDVFQKTQSSSIVSSVVTVDSKHLERRENKERSTLSSDRQDNSERHPLNTFNRFERNAREKRGIHDREKRFINDQRGISSRNRDATLERTLHQRESRGLIETSNKRMSDGTRLIAFYTWRGASRKNNLPYRTSAVTGKSKAGTPEVRFRQNDKRKQVLIEQIPSPIFQNKEKQERSTFPSVLAVGVEIRSIEGNRFLRQTRRKIDVSNKEQRMPLNEHSFNSHGRTREDNCHRFDGRLPDGRDLTKASEQRLIDQIRMSYANRFRRDGSEQRDSTLNRKFFVSRTIPALTIKPESSRLERRIRENTPPLRNTLWRLCSSTLLERSENMQQSTCSVDRNPLYFQEQFRIQRFERVESTDKELRSPDRRSISLVEYRTFAHDRRTTESNLRRDMRRYKQDISATELLSRRIRSEMLQESRNGIRENILQRQSILRRQSSSALLEYGQSTQRSTFSIGQPTVSVEEPTSNRRLKRAVTIDKEQGSSDRRSVFSDESRVFNLNSRTTEHFLRNDIKRQEMGSLIKVYPRRLRTEMFSVLSRKGIQENSVLQYDISGKIRRLEQRSFSNELSNSLRTSELNHRFNLYTHGNRAFDRRTRGEENRRLQAPVFLSRTRLVSLNGLEMQSRRNIDRDIVLRRNSNILQRTENKLYAFDRTISRNAERSYSKRSPEHGVRERREILERENSKLRVHRNIREKDNNVRQLILLPSTLLEPSLVQASVERRVRVSDFHTSLARIISVNIPHSREGKEQVIHLRTNNRYDRDISRRREQITNEQCSSVRNQLIPYSRLTDINSYREVSGLKSIRERRKIFERFHNSQIKFLNRRNGIAFSARKATLPETRILNNERYRKDESVRRDTSNRIPQLVSLNDKVVTRRDTELIRLQHNNHEKTDENRFKLSDKRSVTFKFRLFYSNNHRREEGSNRQSLGSRTILIGVTSQLKGRMERESREAIQQKEDVFRQSSSDRIQRRENNNRVPSISAREVVNAVRRSRIQRRDERDVQEREEALVRNQRAFDRRNQQIQDIRQHRRLSDVVLVSPERKSESSISRRKTDNVNRRDETSRRDQRQTKEMRAMPDTELSNRRIFVVSSKQRSIIAERRKTESGIVQRDVLSEQMLSDRLLVSNKRNYDKIETERRFSDNRQHTLYDRRSTIVINGNRATSFERSLGFISPKRDLKDIRNTFNAQIAPPLEQRRVSSILRRVRDKERTQHSVVRRITTPIQRRTNYDTQIFQRQGRFYYKNRILHGAGSAIQFEEKQRTPELTTRTTKEERYINNKQPLFRHSESPESYTTYSGLRISNNGQITQSDPSISHQQTVIAASLSRQSKSDFHQGVVLGMSKKYDEIQTFNGQNSAISFVSWIGEMFSTIKKAVIGINVVKNILERSEDSAYARFMEYLPGITYNLQTLKLQPDSEMKNNDKGHLLQDFLLGSVVVGYFITSINHKIRDHRNFICIF